MTPEETARAVRDHFRPPRTVHGNYARSRIGRTPDQTGCTIGCRVSVPPIAVRWGGVGHLL
jgi:hypothetical protein